MCLRLDIFLPHPLFQNNKGLHFKNVSEKMLKVIQACHLQDDLKLI